MIIGISGKIGAGKTTLAKHIIYETSHSSHVVRIGFGDELKQEAAEMFSFPVGLAYCENGKTQHILHQDLPGGCMTVRAILQYWGDKRRSQDPDYWVKKLDAKLKKTLPRDKAALVLIDDVRRPNEAEYVISNNGCLVRLNTYNGWKSGKYAKHNSETALDYYKGWDMVLSPGYGADFKSLARDVLRAAFLAHDPPTPMMDHPANLKSAQAVTGPSEE